VRFVAVASAADFPPGTMRTVDAEDWRLVVVNVDGEFFAYDNQCPHNGGPLGKGKLEGGALVCPWHAWRFDARTGRPIWPEGGAWKATRFPVVVEDGQVKVRVA
jgi:nitrite reductase (NADH) small subunit